jgi:hypothetical protein
MEAPRLLTARTWVIAADSGAKPVPAALPELQEGWVNYRVFVIRLSTLNVDAVMGQGTATYGATPSIYLVLIAPSASPLDDNRPAIAPEYSPSLAITLAQI